MDKHHFEELEYFCKTCKDYLTWLECEEHQKLEHDIVAERIGVD